MEFLAAFLELLPYRGRLYLAAVFAAGDRLLEYLVAEFVVPYQWDSRVAAVFVREYQLALLLDAVFAAGFRVLPYHL